MNKIQTLLRSSLFHFGNAGAPSYNFGDPTSLSLPVLVSKRSWLVLIGLPFLIANCGKKEEAHAPTASAVKKESVSQTQVDTEILKSLAESEPEAPVPEISPLAEEAESLLAKHPNKTALELLALPEVNASLKESLEKLAKDKSLQDKMNSSVELAAKLKGLDGTPGSVSLDLDTKNYNRDQKSRMLQAVLSEDPKQLVHFLTEEIGEATPELTYEGVERASNGISIKEKTPPAK